VLQQLDELKQKSKKLLLEERYQKFRAWVRCWKGRLIWWGEAPERPRDVTRA